MLQFISRRLKLTILLLCLYGCATDEPLIPPTPLQQLQPTVASTSAWSLKIASSRQHPASYFAPAIDGDTVFAAHSSGVIAALDRNNGEIRWRREIPTRLSSGVSTDTEKVYVAERDGTLLALDQSDGSTLWRYTMSSEILEPVAAAFDIVVVRSADGRVVGLNAADGSELWRNIYTPPALTLRGYSPPVLLQSGLLLGLDDGKIIALSAKTGKLLWESTLAFPQGRSEVDRLVDIDAEILLDDESIYAVSYQGKLARIEPAQGRQLWSIDFSSVAGLAQSEQTLYIVDERDGIVAVDKNAGAEQWRQEALVGRKLTQPVTVGDYLVVSDLDGYLHILSTSNGELIGRQRLSKKSITAKPIAQAQSVYIQSTDGWLYKAELGS